MITDFQRTVARAFFGLPESKGFAVSGAAALIAHALIDRETRDVDLFTVTPDLAAGKTLALFSRAEARDFVDVYRLAAIFGRDQLLAWAAQQDRGFDVSVFAESLQTIRRFNDDDLPLPTGELLALRDFFADWAHDLRSSRR